MEKVLVVNGHGLGEYCDVKKIPVVGETVKAFNRRFEADAGKGTNVAVAIARLGGDAVFIGKAGEDEGGYLGEKWMGEAGVDLTHYFLDARVATNLGLCIIAEDGSNIILDFDDDANSITIPELTEHMEACTDAAYLVTGFEIPVETSLYAARLGKKMGMKTVLNPSPLEETAVFEDLSFVDYLMINETEAAILMGDCDMSGMHMHKIAEELSSKYRTPNIIITLGADGSIAYTPEGRYSAAAYPAACIDQCGAGDGYLAALVWCLTNGTPLPESMEWASKYAAYIVPNRWRDG